MPIKTLDNIFEKDRNNPEFLEAYLEEKAKLENAVAVLKAREAAGLTQRDLAKNLEFHSLQSPVLKKVPIQV